MNVRTLHRLIIQSGLLLLAGWVIYSFQRSSFYPLLPQLNPGTTMLQVLPAFLNDNLPSLLHVWALALLTAAALPTVFLRRPALAPALWLIVNLFFEWGQALDKNSLFLQKLPNSLAHYFIQGRFDWLDILACFLGAWLASRTLAAAARQDSLPLKRSAVGSRSLTLASVIFGLFSIMATSGHPHGRVNPYGKPIYMSYEDFRNSFAALSAQPITAPGKIYVKDDLLLINDINGGVHIIDNRDPAAPQPLSFLKILGSRDIAVHGHYLYVDSFIDFLVIDINDPSAPKLVQRIEDIFPWEPEIWYPTEYVYDADPKKGVIIGFEGNSPYSRQEN